MSIDTMNSLENVLKSLKAAQAELALADRKAKDLALGKAAAAIGAAQDEILAANAIDVEKARAGGMREALVDRLTLNPARLKSITEGVAQVMRLDDPIGKVKSGWRNLDGLLIEQVAVPLGTISIIYESRPEVTVDAFSLAYKAGCSILLRGSSAALESNKVLVKAIKKGLGEGGIPGAVELADSGSRDEIDDILIARGWIDAVLPRGGKDLIRRVVDNARVPVIETGQGNCHIYVEPSADMGRAVEIIANAKLQRPGVCNAVETVLIRRDALGALLPALANKLAGKAELRCDRDSLAAIGPLPAGLAVKEAVP